MKNLEELCEECWPLGWGTNLFGKVAVWHGLLLITVEQDLEKYIARVYRLNESGRIYLAVGETLHDVLKDVDTWATITWRCHDPV